MSHNGYVLCCTMVLCVCVMHEAVGGPFSMACFAAQWHELANNMHCRHGWYICFQGTKAPKCSRLCIVS